MKKSIKIILSTFFSLLALCIIVFLLFPTMSEEQLFLRETIDLLAYDETIENHNEFYYNDLYNRFNKLFDFDNCQDAINKEVKYLCAENADEAYYHLSAGYAASIIQTHRYDELESELEYSKNLSYEDLKNYYSYLWIYSIISAKKTNSIDHIKVGEIIDKIQYSSENLQEQNLIFRYYWNLYWDIDMTDDFKNKIISLPTYLSSRSTYVLILLKADKYNDFDKLFVNDYINDPFDGVDILILKDDLTKEQLKELDKSLENLKEEFKAKKPKLYEALEKEKIEILQNSVRKEF